MVSYMTNTEIKISFSADITDAERVIEELMSNMPKYVVLFSDGIYPKYEPDAPADDNTANTLEEAKVVFLRMAREAGRDDIATDDGGPWADIELSSNWDGISYGDYHMYRFTLGPRGGINVERW